MFTLDEMEEIRYSLSSRKENLDELIRICDGSLREKFQRKKFAAEGAFKKADRFIEEAKREEE